MKFIFCSFIFIFNLLNFPLIATERDINIENINIYNQNKQINLSLLEGDELRYNKEVLLNGERHFYDAIINFYKEDNLIYSFDYNGQEKQIYLGLGKYDVEILTSLYKPYYFKGINIEVDTHRLNLYFPIELIELKGLVSLGNATFGGVDLILENILGDKYSVTTNIKGEFSVFLPQNIYKIIVNKKGYKQKEELEINTKYFGELESLKIELAEIPSVIKGYVFDDRNRPMQNTKLNIKNNDVEKVTYTNMDGYYELEVEKGLVFVRAEKLGYAPSGTIERVEFFSKKRMKDIVLQELTSSIRGHVSTSINSLKNVRISLYEENGKFVKNVDINNRGYYIFNDVMIHKKYYLSVDSPNYIPYKSEVFKLSEKGLDNFNINLEDFNINFVLELFSAEKIELQNIEIFINDNKYQSDINGIVNEEIKSDKLVEELEVLVLKFNIQKKFKISDLGKEPYLIQINVDNVESIEIEKLDMVEDLEEMFISEELD